MRLFKLTKCMPAQAAELSAMPAALADRPRSRPSFSQDLRAKRDSKLTYLTAWIASFVRVPCL